MLLTTMPLTTMPIQCTYTTFLLFKAAITREYHYVLLLRRADPCHVAQPRAQVLSLVLPFLLFILLSQSERHRLYGFTNT